MKRSNNIIYFVFLVFLTIEMNGAIHFRNLDVKSAIELAKQENKYVFVDTYASWCGPCKVMDRVFEEPAVADYFNSHFINVKIDMEGPYGDQMLYDYEVVWLPTLLIFDSNGNLLSKMEQLLSSQELIEAAENVRSGYNSAVTSSSLSNSPFSSPSTGTAEDQDYDPNEKEEVIYVYDEKASSGRPHIMYHEAYLHLQLMDGQHQKVVKKYLSTQSDWSLEKNIKLIFDFLQDVRSPHFQYFINNRSRFDEVIGKERVTKSLDILIMQHITKGFPRPSLKEAKQLYGYLDPAQADQKAYDYYLPRIFRENKKDDYLTEAHKYLLDINPFDIKVITKFVGLRIEKNELSSLSESIDMIELALSLDSQNPNIHFLAASLYFHQKEKVTALEHITKAIALTQYENGDTRAYESLKGQIYEL